MPLDYKSPDQVDEIREIICNYDDNVNNKNILTQIKIQVNEAVLYCNNVYTGTRVGKMVIYKL